MRYTIMLLVVSWHKEQDTNTDGTRVQTEIAIFNGSYWLYSWAGISEFGFYTRACCRATRCTILLVVGSYRARCNRDLFFTHWP